MSLVGAASTEPALPPDRRNMLKWPAAPAGSAGAPAAAAAPTREPPAPRPGSNPRSRAAGQPTGKLEKGNYIPDALDTRCSVRHLIMLQDALDER